MGSTITSIDLKDLSGGSISSNLSSKETGGQIVIQETREDMLAAMRK